MINVKKKLSLLLVGAVLLGNTQAISAKVNSEVGIGDSILQKQRPWELVWSDEFNGNSLNEDYWSYDVGNWIVDEEGNGVSPGWGNGEAVYYTEGNNISFRDGNLVITAKKEKAFDKFGNYDYTSSKIKTHEKVAKKYGRIEARIKLPQGSGLWPAFWMMPEDDIYGGWAASGEIDILEARGTWPGGVYGTLHHGGKWPSNNHTGGYYTFPEGQDYTQYHEYAVEWEPGEIRWYVDGNLYQTQNRWNSYGEDGSEKFAFPAPFDQEFYIILNLSVGGWFDGGAMPGEDFESAEMLVDYVRVYEKDTPYLEPVEPTIDKEPIPEGAKLPIDGNYIYDTNFETGFNNVTSGEIPFTEYWNLVTMPQFGGSGSINVDNINGEKFAKIDITKAGNEVHSIQLIQNATLTKGRSYKLTYDAKAAKNRDVTVKLCGGEDRGWDNYSGVYSDSLSEEIKKYSHIFTMEKDSDINARLEFNIGLDNNSVWIGNIKLEEVDLNIDVNGPKEPLNNGNYIYNGAFDKGKIDRLTYWNLEKAKGADASYSVNESTRELFININNGSSNLSDVVVNQKGVKFEGNGKYVLKFDARADKDKTIKVIAKDTDGNRIYESQDILIGNSMNTQKMEFNVPSELATNTGILEFCFGGDNTSVYLDNVSLINNKDVNVDDLNTFPLKNGNFEQGTLGWNAWSWFSFDSYLDESTIENGAIKLDIPEFAGQDSSESWAVQLKQTGLPVYKGVEYVISFDASSSVDRDFELVAQNSAYTRLFEKKTSLGKERKRYTYSFVPDRDDIVELNFLLGNYGTTEPHSITVDNVVFEVKNSATNKIVNNKFEKEDDSWEQWSQNGDATTNIVDEKYELKIDSLGDEFWGVQLFQEGFTLENGRSYRLVFDMSSSTPRVADAIVENNKKVLWEQVAINEKLNTYTFDFVYNGDNDLKSKLNFCLGSVNGQDTSIDEHTITLDNVYLYEIPNLSIEEPTTPEIEQKIGDKLINDGDFKIDLGKWSLWKEWTDANAEVVNEEAKITINNINPERKFDPQFIRGDLAFVKGNTYKVTFDARADEARSIEVNIGQPLSTDPWFKQYGGPETFNITSDMKSYEYVFTVTEDTITNGQLVFELGHIDENSVATNVYIDNANIEVVSTLEDQAKVNKVIELINALPENIKLEDKAKVKAARAAYETLTENQKALVPTEVLNKLILAEEKIAELEENIEGNNGNVGENNGEDNGNADGDNGNLDDVVKPGDTNEDENLPQTGGMNYSHLVFAALTLVVSGLFLVKKELFNN